MRTGNHARKEKTDSKENVKIEGEHSTRKATGTWAEGMQMTSEEHMTWQRSAKKRRKSRKGSIRAMGKRTSREETIENSAETSSTETPTSSNSKKRNS